jgi:hypothetical protein
VSPRFANVSTTRTGASRKTYILEPRSVDRSDTGLFIDTASPMLLAFQRRDHLIMTFAA